MLTLADAQYFNDALVEKLKPGGLSVEETVFFRQSLITLVHMGLTSDDSNCESAAWDVLESLGLIADAPAEIRFRAKLDG